MTDLSGLRFLQQCGWWFRFLGCDSLFDEWFPTFWRCHSFSQH